ncbi:unnamed protein product [Meganyctiphanes norvegica]|uniref:Kelch-like protein diablo n=1 Tax=Meganyctiphanes norvegica TaxID=48144 RepID=A0AAV2RHT2_MEGNR
MFCIRCSEIVEDVEDSGWRGCLSRGLHEAWQSGLFTDLAITTNDQVIHAHKLVLAAASPYFRAMLTGRLLEGQTETLSLEDVPASTLKVVLQYVYSGRARLTCENVEDVLTLADYFQIHALKKVCCYFLKSNLSVSNCLSVYERAKLHNCLDLASVSLNMALEQCSEVLREPSFNDLQPDTLLNLLKQPYLNVKAEEDILKAVLQWASYDVDTRRKWLPGLVQRIQLASFSMQKRQDYINVASDMDVLSDELRDLLDPIEYDLLQQPSINDQDENSSRTNKARHKAQEEVLVVMGGECNGSLLGNMECFALGYSSWRCSIPVTANGGLKAPKPQLQVLPAMSNARAYAAVASEENLVYVLGGQTSKTFLSSCECFSVSSNTWSSLADLPLPVHGSGAVFLDGMLYMLGGKSQNQYEDKCMMYHSNMNEWVFRSALSSPRGHLGVAALNGSLFALGGMAGAKHVLDSCEKYDPASNSWIPIASMLQPRAYMGVAVLGNHIYVLGGYDGNCWLQSVERYDTLRDNWSRVSPMISCRSSFGVTVSHGRIYCMGGFSGESLTNSVEKYNPRTDMWHCVQSMQLRRYAHVAATVVLPGGD